jgi:transcriptional regulator with GAF, ATPase, and Fis domain
MSKPILDLTRELSALSDVIDRYANLDDFLEAGLSWLEQVVSYDLATIWEVNGESLRVRWARGSLASPAVFEHRIDLTKHPVLRRVIHERLPRINSAEDHAHGEGDLFEDVIPLPHGHGCMVVPLCAGDKALGLLSLDKAVCETWNSATLQLVEIYARILALGLVNAAQAQRLTRLYETERERLQLLQSGDTSKHDSKRTMAESKSTAMQRVIEQAKIVARSNSPVLIVGETGVGKEIMAEAIHNWSERHSASLIRINCASIPETLLESELFGHVKGAFTGATQTRQGRFRAANGGTLFLDEIGDMPIALQAKILRVLQEGTFEPVGSDQTIKVDVRIIAATHVNLAEAIRSKTFREDLYYRLNVFPIAIPPLRERLEDIDTLAVTILEKHKRGKKPAPKLSRDALSWLKSQAWPGNIRELSNAIERATILAGQADNISLEHFQTTTQDRHIPNSSIVEKNQPMKVEKLDVAVATHIKAALKLSGGKIYGDDGAAAILGLKPSTLQSKIKKLGRLMK